jgi:hypothetical protein
MGQVAHENRQISEKYGRLLKFFLKFEKDRSPMKIDQCLNLRRVGYSLKVTSF